MKAAADLPASSVANDDDVAFTSTGTRPTLRRAAEVRPEREPARFDRTLLGGGAANAQHNVTQRSPVFDVAPVGVTARSSSREAAPSTEDAILEAETIRFEAQPEAQTIRFEAPPREAPPPAPIPNGEVSGLVATPDLPARDAARLAIARRSARPVRSAPRAMTALGALTLAASAALAALAMFPRAGAVHVAVATEGGVALQSAAVLLDGKLQCTSSPCEIEGVRAGDHVVRVVEPGIGMSDAPVLVEGGRERSVLIVLPNAASQQ